MSPSQFHQFRARTFETSGCLSKLICLIARAVHCIKMDTTDAYTATGIKCQRNRDTADVSKVRRTFLRESEIFLSSADT